MHSSIIITAANSFFVPFTFELIESIRALIGTRGVDIGVIDVGLSQIERQKLEEMGVCIKTARVDIDYQGQVEFEQKFPFIRAMTSRPFLPDYFPGYQTYLWMDSDTWLQTSEMLNEVLPYAVDDALYIGAEFDRDYKMLFVSAALWQVHLNWYRGLFAPDVANKMSLRPMLNSGVFAASARSPVWGIWQRIYADTLRRVPVLSQEYFMADQLSLNVAVYLSELPKQILPAEYNWLCFQSLPAFDGERKTFVRPGVPHTTLSVLHLANDIKNTPQTIKTSNNSFLRTALTYTAYKELQK